MSGRMRDALNVAVLCVLAALIPGCRPAGVAYSYLQFHSVDLQVVKSVMTITAGDGEADARRYMDSARYAGSCRMGSVTVYYPEGREATANEVARAFADTANLVAIRMGIEWSLRLEIRLIEAPPRMTGFTYSVPLKRDRVLVFPLFINSDGQARAEWAPVVAHEMTEASLIAPEDERKMALGDAYAGRFCISTGTRWFRDGVADRAGYVLGERLFPGRYQPSASGYRDLERVNGAVLGWSNCADAPDYYAASAALMLEAENAVGENAISRVMDELASERVHGGRSVRRAFQRATGLPMPDFVTTYTRPWLGADFRDTEPDTSNPPLVMPGNEAVVRAVQADSPASRWRIERGDIVVSAGGVSVTSADQLGHLIARHKPGERLDLVLRRKGELMSVRPKLMRK